MTFLWVAYLSLLIVASPGLSLGSESVDSLGSRFSTALNLDGLVDLGINISFPGSAAYNESLNSYFSLQEAQLRPIFILSPSSTSDVSVAMQIISQSLAVLPADERAALHVAVRSGGHLQFAGAANIQNGITFDLRGLSGIEVSSDRSTVSVGVGATWGDVYAQLDPMGLMVAGGRAAQVGVGGLTVGGGVSYFSPRYGWTCDSVVSFEVVLANGTVVEANENHNSDLLWALRGGSNNFGIVTRIDLKVFEQGLIWGGSVYNDVSTIQQQLQSLVNFTTADDYDEYASLIVSFGYAAGQGSAIVNSIEYTKPVENPPVFQPFTQIPQLASTLRITSVANITAEQGSFSPNGLRQLTATTTYAADVRILQTTYDLWNSSIQTIQNVTGLVWSISLEPLPPIIYARAAASNALGLSNTTEALVIVELTATWSSEEDDQVMDSTARSYIASLESTAKDLGVYHPFQYLNYAGSWQDPIVSYGSDSVERLKAVSHEWDPTGFFQTNVPGGFKLPK